MQAMNRYDSFKKFVNAIYTSVWEDGTAISSDCKLDIINLRVHEIEDSEDDSNHGCLVSEYVDFYNENIKMPQRLNQDELYFAYKEN
jgi:hypothetical protein